MVVSQPKLSSPLALTAGERPGGAPAVPLAAPVGTTARGR